MLAVCRKTSVSALMPACVHTVVASVVAYGIDRNSTSTEIDQVSWLLRTSKLETVININYAQYIYFLVSCLGFYRQLP